jgi:hypothetical protein
MAEYRWASHRQHPTDAEPQRVAEWLAQVEDRRGEITAATVADHAEADPADPVAAPWFTWDPELATRKCHEYEARDMIRSVVVVYVTPQQGRPTPAYVSIVNDAGHHTYVRTEVAISQGDSAQLERLLSETQQQIHGMAARLDALVELVGLMGRRRANGHGP